MRVALFSETFLPKIDGIVNTLCHLMTHLETRGHESLLFAPAGGPATYAATRIVALPAVPFPWYSELRLAPPLSGVARQLEVFQPDVVHSLNPVSLGLGGLYHGRRLGVPVVASYHTDIPGFAAHWGLGALAPVLWALIRWVHGQADLNLCPSRATREELAAHGVRDVALWARGVDTERFHPNRRSAAWRRLLTAGQPDRPLLLFTGRLSPEKRVDWLADCVDQLPGARLAVVGDGPARKALEARFRGRPVVFAGYLRGEDLAAAYATADVFVFPGANETFGNVVLEAAASGLPVVAPRAGGVVDHVAHDVTGLLFDPGSRRAMVRCVRQVLDDPARARQLGRDARRQAEGRTWPAVMDDLLDRYEALVATRSGRAPRAA